MPHFMHLFVSFFYYCFIVGIVYHISLPQRRIRHGLSPHMPTQMNAYDRVKCVIGEELETIKCFTDSPSQWI
jgi:hypothetical protein